MKLPLLENDQKSLPRNSGITLPSKTPTREIVIDLFAGCGGMGLGFESAGFEVAAAIEIDPIACAVHEFNAPHTPILCADCRKVTGEEIRRRSGIGDKPIAVVFGGSPCQGFSLVGKRQLDDPRNELLAHFLRLVLELRPRYFCFENVPGITYGEHRSLLEELIAGFEANGYSVAPPQILNAADYGVPQDRKRLFLLGAQPGFDLPVYPLPQAERVSVWEAIGDLPDPELYPELLMRDWVNISPRSIPTRYNEDFAHRRYQYDPRILTSSALTNHSEESRLRFRGTPHGKTEPVSHLPKLDPDGLCPTLRAGTGSDKGSHTAPRPIHPHSDRCITVREAARLHSYPDWFRFHATKWHGFRQVGNSVPPLLARAIASEVLKVCEGDDRAKNLIKIVPFGSEKLLTLTKTEALSYYANK